MTRYSLRVVALTVMILSGSTLVVNASGHRATTQVGLASYYGSGFNGHKTASGEVFDQRELVAAHRTLPLGSVVKVTNLANGRSTVLRVIDRGPFGRNRRRGCVIDVSHAAARQLRFARAGVTRVRIDVLRLPQ